jgi:drug/metabolite transporter (DMT)-like permease
MKKSYFKYITSLFLFGTNGIVASYILLSSTEIVFTRTLIGSLFLILAFSFAKNRTQIDNKMHLFYLIVSGVAMGTSWMFLYEAYSQIGVSIATLSYYCGPVIVMILSPILFREKMTRAKLFGFLSVLIGMLFVNNHALAKGATVWGLICGIMSAIMYALMVIFNKKAVSVTGLKNSMCQLFTSFITVSIFLGLHQGFFISFEPENLLPILILGIVNTGIGCYFYFSSIGNLPIQTVAICGYLEPLLALFFSAVFLGETMSFVQIVGSILILGGAAFAELFCRKDQKNLRNK